MHVLKNHFNWLSFFGFLNSKPVQLLKILPFLGFNSLLSM